MSPIWITIIITASALLLLLSDRLRPDLVALLTTLALGLTGVLTVQETFSGFSRSAVITIMAIFILADGLKRTGVTERAGNLLLRLAGTAERSLTVAILLGGAGLSLFMNNIAAASILLPAVTGAAKKARVSQARLLMPLAFGTILGGMATLLTTTNIIASSLLRDRNLVGFGLFDFFPLGSLLVLAGLLYMTFIGRRLLPGKTPTQRLLDQSPDQPSESTDLLHIYRLEERVLRARLKADSDLVGKSLADSRLRENYKVNVVILERGGARLFPFTPQVILHTGDILSLVGRPEDYRLDDLEEQFDLLDPEGWRQAYTTAPGVFLIEAVLTPRSVMLGHTLREMQFREKYGVNVIAVWRGGKPVRSRLSNLPLQFGDALLMDGTAAALPALRTEPGLLVLNNTGLTPPRFDRRAWSGVLVLIVTLVLGAIFSARVGELMLFGALALVLTKVLTMDQAYQSIEWKTVFLIAGMLPLGIAMTKTGLAANLAEILLNLPGSETALGLLGLLVLVTVLLSQVMNGAAVLTIIAPIAIQAAEAGGLNPRALVMGVALASSLAFVTPLGHPVNILVMGQAGYSFGDFAKVGLPLVLLLIGLILWLLPLFWPLVV
jgi:di/tricarboxylate transporter